MKYTSSQIRSKLLEIVFNDLIAALPNRLAGNLRPSFLRLMGAQVGDRVKISRRVKVLGAKSLVIGDSVAIANSVILDARGGLTLHGGSLIGFEAVLLTHTHAWPDPKVPVHDQGTVSAPVEIGRNAWIGARVFVLPGASVGESSVIGANSVVSKPIPALSVAVGIPAKVISARIDKSEWS